MAAKQVSSIIFMGKPMQFDSNNFCRCCLTDKSLVSMSDSDQVDGATFQSLYDSICPIPTPLGGFSKICESCIFNLRLAYQFHQMCRQSNAKVKEIMLANFREKRNNQTGELVNEQRGNDTNEQVNIEPLVDQSGPAEKKYEDEPIIDLNSESFTMLTDAILDEIDQSITEDKATMFQNDATGLSTEIKIEEHETMMEQLAAIGKAVVIPPLGNQCDICYCERQSERELILHYKWSHPTLLFIQSYSRYHRAFFPECGYSNPQIKTFKNHLATRHHTSPKQIYEYNLELDALKKQPPSKPASLNCAICDHSSRNYKEVIQHLRENHKSLRFLQSYVRYHRKFFPECRFTTKDVKCYPCRGLAPPSRIVADYKCLICNRNHRNKSEIRLHMSMEHIKPLQHHWYIKYHRDFYPDCVCKRKKTLLHLKHMFEKHNTTFEQIYYYAVQNGLESNQVLREPQKPIVKQEDTTANDAKIITGSSLRVDGNGCEELPLTKKIMNKCSYCTAIFYTSTALSAHKYKVHGDEMKNRYSLYYCNKFFPVCTFKTKQIIALKQHIIKAHKTSYEQLTGQDVARKSAVKVYKLVKWPEKQSDPLSMPEGDPLVLPKSEES